MPTAILGTGLMGAAMARRLLDQGVEVRVWNRTPEPTAALRPLGARVCATAAQAVAEADIVLLALSDAPAIEKVLDDAAVARAVEGRLLAQMGTIAPAQSRALAQRVQTLGGDWLEAPVLGSLPEAASGTLLIMPAGSAAARARARPLLERLGRMPCELDEIGQAAALKLALNQLIASLTAAFALSLGLVRREGVPVADFMAVLRQSALYAPTFDKKLERELKRRFDNPNFPLKHLLKDIDLFRDAAARDGLHTAPLDGVRQVVAAGVAAGLGEMDYSALYAVIDPDTR